MDKTKGVESGEGGGNGRGGVAVGGKCRQLYFQQEKATGFLYIILEVASHHVCCIQFIENQSLCLDYTLKERGLHKDTNTRR